MKWVQEQLNQCVAGQNGHSRWDKRAASYWSEDTATAKSLAEELAQSNDEIQDDQLVKCAKKNLATTLAPKVPLLRPIVKQDRKEMLPAALPIVLPEPVTDVLDPRAANLAPGLISVASCDTDQEESLALRLLRFNPNETRSSQSRSAASMRFLSLLRNVRRLESQYVESGKPGRMLASDIVELPAFLYTSSSSSASSADTKRCAICLSEFADDQELRVLPCIHTYHSWCIDKWLLYNCNCPVCNLSP